MISATRIFKTEGAIESDATYTSLVIDLIDNYDQRTITGDLSRPLDRVHGYTINQIESVLYGNGGVSLFNNWKHNLLNMFDNSTEQFVHELFLNWDPLQ